MTSPSTHLPLSDPWRPWPEIVDESDLWEFLCMPNKITTKLYISLGNSQLTTARLYLITKWFCLCAVILHNLNHFLKILFIYFEREWKGGRMRGRETPCARDTLIGCLLHAPNQGPRLQSRLVPWPGTEPATSQFTGWCSIHWATPARAISTIFICSRETLAQTFLNWLPMWSGGETGHQNWVMNIYSNWGFLHVTSHGVATCSASPKPRFKTAWPALLPNPEVPLGACSSVQKDCLGVYLFIEKKLFKEQKTCCPLRESHLSGC